MDENQRRRDTAREAWLTQLTPERRREELGKLAEEAERISEQEDGSQERDPFDGDGLLWVPAEDRAGLQAAIAEVAQREYEDSITSHGTVALAEHLGCRIAVEVMRVLGLQGPVEGGHQDREDPTQQAQGDQVHAGPDAERGQAEADRPGKQE